MTLKELEYELAEARKRGAHDESLVWQRNEHGNLTRITQVRLENVSQNGTCVTIR